MSSEAIIYDYSLLPEVAWINIFKELSLEDRYKLSQTCHTLQQHFHHPSVWHTVTIPFTGADGKIPGQLLPTPSELHLIDKYKIMIEKFGGYFQDLTLAFYGIIRGLSPEHRATIEELGKKCRLRSLTLYVGTAPSMLRSEYLRITVEHLQVIAAVLSNAFRLRSFCLKSWPSFEKVNILDALMANERLKNLSTLNVLYRCAAEATWVTGSAPLPDASYIVRVAKHFTSLTSLSIRSELLTQAVIEELAKVGQLNTLQVMIVYSTQTRAHLPEISAQSWGRLAKSCPELTVHLNFVNRMPYIEKSGYMKLEIPVTAVSFMKYANCTTSDVQSIMEKYSSGLVRFMNYSDSGDLDDQLVALVERCKNLTHFSSCGPILQQTVVKLASQRPDNWKCFEVKEDKINVSLTGEDFDEDTVIATTSSGEVVMTQVERLRLNSEEEQRRRYLELVDRVSGLLHRKWAPLPSNFLEEDLQHLQNKKQGDEIFQIYGR